MKLNSCQRQALGSRLVALGNHIKARASLMPEAFYGSSLAIQSARALRYLDVALEQEHVAELWDQFAELRSDGAPRDAGGDL